MVNRNLIRSLEDDEILADLALMAPEDEVEEWMIENFSAEQQDYNSGNIVDGRIVEINDEWALVDVGFKSEGTVGLDDLRRAMNLDLGEVISRFACPVQE